MKVEIVRLPSQTRCQKIVNPGRLGNYLSSSKRCARHARYSLNGVNLCPRHAGEMSLMYLLDNEKGSTHGK